MKKTIRILPLSIFLIFGIISFISFSKNQPCREVQRKTISIQETWVRHATRGSSPMPWIRSSEGDLYYLRSEFYSTYYHSCFSKPGEELVALIDTSRIYRDNETGETTNQQIVEVEHNGVQLFSIEDENHIRNRNRWIALLFGCIFMFPIVLLVILALIMVFMQSPFFKHR